jgi:hypothetical protein
MNSNDTQTKKLTLLINQLKTTLNQLEMEINPTLARKVSYEDILVYNEVDGDGWVGL